LLGLDEAGKHLRRMENRRWPPLVELCPAPLPALGKTSL
jgi:hypothetical protein